MCSMFRLGRSTDLSPADIDIILITWIIRKRIKMFNQSRDLIIHYLGSNISSCLVVVLYGGTAPLRNEGEDGLCHGGHQARVLVLQQPGPREHGGRLPGPPSPHQVDLPLAVVLLHAVEQREQEVSVSLTDPVLSPGPGLKHLLGLLARHLGQGRHVVQEILLVHRLTRKRRKTGIHRAGGQRVGVVRLLPKGLR